MGATSHFCALRDEKKAIETERNALKEIVDQFNPPTDNIDKSALSNSLYWNELNVLFAKAVNDYPSWKETQRKVQKTGNLQGWLTKVVQADNREAEIIKKILSDFFQEL